MSDASMPSKTGGHDWTRFDSLSPEQRETAAREDRDSQALTREDAARMRRTPRAKIIRRALGWSEDRFSRVFHIPVALLREWESGHVVPDEPASAYLEVIASRPDIVADVLSGMRRDADHTVT